MRMWYLISHLRELFLPSPVACRRSYDLRHATGDKRYKAESCRQTPCVVILTCGPHIGQVALLGRQLREPRFGLRFAGAGLRSVDAGKGGPDIRRHFAGITANVDHGPFLDELPNLVLALQDQLLDIGLGLSIQPRKSQLQSGHALRYERVELILIDEILLWMAAAKEQQRRADRLPLRLQSRPLLQKTPERSQARARPY